MTTYIRTRLLKATDTRGVRIRAYLSGPDGGQATVPYDYGMNAPENHARAAVALLNALGVRGTVKESRHTTPRGYVFEVNES